jgi:ankyrin repeat protein
MALDPEVVEQFVTACHSDLVRVKALLAEHPSLLEARSKLDESGLEAAAHVNQRAIVEFLLSQGARLDLCTAVMLGRHDTVREMVESTSDLSGAVGSHGIPVMTFAAINGAVDIAQTLFGKGAPVDAAPGVMTPIHMAVYMNRLQMVEWLIEHHANLDATVGGDTPLQVAEKQKRVDVLEVFRRHAAPETAA